MQKETITLVRALGLVAAISIIIGNVVGTGVFLKARVMTCNVCSPEWVLIAWIAAGLLSFRDPDGSLMEFISYAS